MAEPAAVSLAQAVPPAARGVGRPGPRFDSAIGGGFLLVGATQRHPVAVRDEHRVQVVLARAVASPKFRWSVDNRRVVVEVPSDLGSAPAPIASHGERSEVDSFAADLPTIAHRLDEGRKCEQPSTELIHASLIVRPCRPSLLRLRMSSEWVSLVRVRGQHAGMVGVCRQTMPSRSDATGPFVTAFLDDRSSIIELAVAGHWNRDLWL
jgi:hypothetical protein